MKAVPRREYRTALVAVRYVPNQMRIDRNGRLVVLMVPLSTSFPSAKRTQQVLRLAASLALSADTRWYARTRARKNEAGTARGGCLSRYGSGKSSSWSRSATEPGSRGTPTLLNLRVHQRLARTAREEERTDALALTPTMVLHVAYCSPQQYGIATTRSFGY